LKKKEIIDTLNEIKENLTAKNNSLFLGLVDQLINRVRIFGLFFDSLDITQDSSVHHEVLKMIAEKTDALPKNYKDLSEEDKIEALLSEIGRASCRERAED